MSALAAAGITHPGMSEIEREYAGKKLTPLKLDAESGDTILVPEEVAREMQRLAAEVRTCPVWISNVRFPNVFPRHRLILVATPLRQLKRCIWRHNPGCRNQRRLLRPLVEPLRRNLWGRLRWKRA